MKRNMIKFSKLLASLALMVTASNINTTCLFIAHQPELPAEANKLRKF
nr:cyclic lactone autoinducer peptide [Sedimentibacter sp.]